jgi:hypothetical protein
MASQQSSGKLVDAEAPSITVTFVKPSLHVISNNLELTFADVSDEQMAGLDRFTKDNCPRSKDCANVGGNHSWLETKNFRELGASRSACLLSCAT